MAYDEPAAPYFGILPHTPDRCGTDPCETCGGACRRRGSGFVCMGCHGVRPTLQRRLDNERREAELIERRRKLAEKKIKFKARLTAKQRRSLVAEHGAEAEAWLAEVDRSCDAEPNG